MQYISTRGQAPALGFEDTFLTGLARDGGLYVPEAWPALSLDGLSGASFAEAAWRVAEPFTAGQINPEAMRGILDQAYGRFAHPAKCPLVQIADNLYIQELFHGPTLAFKDVAMQVIGGLFEHVLEKRQERVTIIGATSGDTGSAAIEALRGRKGVDVFILHPHGRTSDVQRKQMTTVHDSNVFNIAIDGTFDDCQDLVKACFNDLAFRDRVSMSGVNSINFGRIMPQTTYYLTAAMALGGGAGRDVQFTVPTGNFGDVFAGYAAQQMGVPIKRLVVATNQNDILTRAMTTGDHSLGRVHPTQSPSMDIQISSNFERLLFDLYDRDGAAVRVLMDKLKTNKKFELPAERRDRLKSLWGAERCDEQQTTDTIRRIYQDAGYLLDPHTAVGVFAAEEDVKKTGDTDAPMVVLATAHPAKFPDAVEQAAGVRPGLPAHLADLYEREEKYKVMANELAVLQQYVTDHVQA